MTVIIRLYFPEYFLRLRNPAFAQQNGYFVHQYDLCLFLCHLALALETFIQHMQTLVSLLHLVAFEKQHIVSQDSLYVRVCGFLT